MDLTYSIGMVQFDRKYITLSNNLFLFTRIEKVVIDGSVIENFEDYFYLMDSEDYIHIPNDKFGYNTYVVMWNETKSKITADSIYEILFYTDDDMKVEMTEPSNHEEYEDQFGPVEDKQSYDKSAEVEDENNVDVNTTLINYGVKTLCF